MRAFRIAYDGRPFYGFQRQPDVPTVEDAILDALEALDVLDSSAASGAGTGEAAGEVSDRRTRPIPPGYAAAGRTDAGVSALAQTIAFEAPTWLTPRALSAELPDAVHAWAHADVPAGEPGATADFHATHDATRRRYVYHLHASVEEGSSGKRTGTDLALERASDALSQIAGEHDFAALTPDESGTVRTLATDCSREGAFLALEIEAGGFPRHLVRRIAALVDLVVSGEQGPSFVDRVLAEPGADADTAVDGRPGIPTAPAEPLVLEGVDYPDLEFRVDETAAAGTREAIEERRIAAATRARTMDRIGRGI